MVRKNRKVGKKVVVQGPCPPGDVDTLSFAGAELDRLHKAIRDAKRAMADWDEELDDLRAERAKKRKMEATVMEKMGLATQMLREPFETSSSSGEEEEEEEEEEPEPGEAIAEGPPMPSQAPKMTSASRSSRPVSPRRRPTKK